MIRNINAGQLIHLIDAVFGFRDHEGALTFFVDLPDDRVPDSPGWKDRRRLAAEWYLMLHDQWQNIPFTALALCAYPNVGTNNGNLPGHVRLIEKIERDGAITSAPELSMDEVLTQSSVVIASTELSATAPLKVLARKFGFRGATMPGFSRAMIPALGLDYQEVNRRVVEFQERMNRASGADVLLASGGRSYTLHLDLRFRSAHASGGVIREPGNVANLPSGEAYIVPYEGEMEGEPSKTEGVLPVQFQDEVVLFRIHGNRAVGVESEGEASDHQRELLQSEPAYGNIAELGIGVLGEWGVQAVGSTLLDEKLGLHIAFGRSEHFGGTIGPGSFHSPQRVIHIDWVYVPSVQPRISVEHVQFVYDELASEDILRQGKFVV
jgi:hypothetical protein